MLISCSNSDKEKSYDFDENGISREVLSNYLDRAVTMAFFLVPENPEGRREYPYHHDDIRLIKNIGAKFIGRSIHRKKQLNRFGVTNRKERPTRRIVDNILRTPPINS